SISEIEATKYSRLEFENTIFTLKSDDKSIDGLRVLKKSADVHPKSRRPIHIDFYAVDMLSEVRVHVKVKYVGKPEGVMSGGIVQEIRHDVEVECLPNNIPDVIELDITSMKLHDTLHASDLKLPEDVVLITSPEEALVSVAEPKAEEPAAEASAEATSTETAAAEKKD
ncbi:MAG: 50S ribosomal protein L25, partial [Bdellovibrionales bacterium]|nr:50S ribosomal protein L25 [Bdellovibrionales bacterium]